MKDITPAIEIPIKQRKANGWAFQECLSRIDLSKVITVLDIRYGTGDWARRLRERAPHVQIFGFEVDSVTAKIAYRGCVELAVAEYVGEQLPLWPAEYDLLLADFNNLTRLKAEPLHVALRAANPQWVVFTDVASAKLHINFASYGLDNPDLAEYYRRFSLPGYELLGYERKHFPASTSVWRKNKPPQARGRKGTTG